MEKTDFNNTHIDPAPQDAAEGEQARHSGASIGGGGAQDSSPWTRLIAGALQLGDARAMKDTSLTQFIQDVSNAVSASATSLYLFNAKQELKHEVSFGLSVKAAGLIEEMAQGEASMWLINRQDAPYIVEDMQADAATSTSAESYLGMLAGEGIATLVALPIAAHGALLGFFTLYHNDRRSYGKEELDNLSLIAKVMAMALLNQRLSEARQVEDKGRDNFISALSHELRTPLTSIIGFTQMIRRKLATAPSGRDGAGDGRIAEQMEVIWSQAQRLNRLIDTFVDIANIEQGDFTLRFGRVELVTTLKSAVGQTSAQLESPHQLEVDAPDHPVWVQGDRQRLEQVFVHIVSNALRYSPPGAPVVIKCRDSAADYRVEISVTDKGPGISKDLREAVFERFYQAEALRSGGLGVGLYLSKTIVEAHGGQVLVESEPGEGTTMSITLPLLGV